MYSVTESSNSLIGEMISSYKRDGITVNTFTPKIDFIQRKKCDIQIKDRIESIIKQKI